MMQSLFEILAELFEEDLSAFTLETTKDDIERWDSMGVIDLVTQLESTYNITFDLMEVETLNSVKSIVETLKGKGVSLD